MFSPEAQSLNWCAQKTARRLPDTKVSLSRGNFLLKMKEAVGVILRGAVIENLVSRKPDWKKSEKSGTDKSTWGKESSGPWSKDKPAKKTWDRDSKKSAPSSSRGASPDRRGDKSGPSSKGGPSSRKPSR
jgi:hypothetical protein